MTHSLLSAYRYQYQEFQDFEDAEGNITKTADEQSDEARESFLRTLRREPSAPSAAMQRGIDFEDLVTAIIKGSANPKAKWYEAAEQVARIVKGAKLQFVAKKDIRVGDMPLLLYGRLDALKAGGICDIKYSGSYERGKFVDSTQHPMYFELIPEAREFRYLVSNGTWVWTERYFREDTPSIIPVINEFLSYLDMQGLMDVYREKWLAL